MVQTAVEVADGRLPVVAGVAGIDINHVIEPAKNAHARRRTYAMIPAPFYDSIDQDGLYEWYRILSETLDMGNHDLRPVLAERPGHEPRTARSWSAWPG